MILDRIWRLFFKVDEVLEIVRIAGLFAIFVLIEDGRQTLKLIVFVVFPLDFLDDEFQLKVFLLNDTMVDLADILAEGVE